MKVLKNEKNRLLETFGSIYFILSLFLLLGDSFFNPASSIKYFFIDSRFIYTIFVITHVLFSLGKKQFIFEKVIEFNNKLIFPIVTTTFILSAIVNGLTYPNFIFNTLALNLEIFKYVFYISGFVLLANIKVDWLNTFSQRLLYFGGVLVWMFISLFSAFYPDIYKSLLKEDGFFENLQFLFYLTSSLVSFLIFYCLIKNKKEIIALFFLFLGIGLFFISGEEISWGQRFFQIQTPENLARINYQKEITVHNIGFFQSKIDYIYMTVGLWGAFGAILVRKFLPKFYKKYYLIFPPPIIFFYFFAVARYYFLNQFVMFNYQLFSFEKVGIGDRQEFPETMLAFGFLCFVLLTLGYIRKNS